MEFLHSFLRCHLAGKPMVASRNVCCFLKLPLSGNVPRAARRRSSCSEARGYCSLEHWLYRIATQTDLSWMLSVEAKSMFKFSLEVKKEILLFWWYQLWKMVPTYPGTDDFWRADNWPKLVSSLVSLLYPSCCYSSTVITFAALPEHWIIICNRRSHDFNCFNSTVNKGDTRHQL